ncbi:MAG: presenilin family intramembrane aspartyl protease PSH [Cuniculiplasma sp.]
MQSRKIATEAGTAILFLIASLIGLVMALELESVAPTNPSQNTSAGFGYVLYFIVAVILMSAVILYVSKKKKTGILKVIFVLSMVFVIYIVSSLLYALLPINYPEYYFLSFGTPVLFLYLLLFRQNWIIINIAGVLTSAGLAAIWGVDLGLYAAIVLMIVFAVYDYIAVYKTKHMLDIARATTSSNMPLFFIVPENLNFDMKDTDIDAPREEGRERGAIMIGFGDIAIPNVMVLSSYLYGGTTTFFILPLLGGIVAMFALFSFIKRPAPGLPFLNTGVLLGFVIALLIRTF